jgi:hypothetical protein
MDKRRGDGSSYDAISRRMGGIKCANQLNSYFLAKYPIPIEILLKLCILLDISVDRIMDVALKSYDEIKDKELIKDCPYSDIKNYYIFYSDKEDKLVWMKKDELENDPVLSLKYKRQRKPHVKQK